jgi:hypothetical protein
MVVMTIPIVFGIRRQSDYGHHQLPGSATTLIHLQYFPCVNSFSSIALSADQHHRRITTSHCHTPSHYEPHHTTIDHDGTWHLDLIDPLPSEELH